ncbi:DnaA ATPase domain-containing protein, partial [Staphylococcus epidermidis]|uniref:DnaA ATPase domain-containing protein n=1 Tax=Staphylococcus epidermidis TaxID=1282 RepID=UPI0037D9D6B0
PHPPTLPVPQPPPQPYNPLFIYPPVPLRKTHLIHPIPHHLLTNKPNAKLIYTSTHKFTNQFIKSIPHNQTQPFPQNYPKIHLLLIHHIQFIQN